MKGIKEIILCFLFVSVIQCNMIKIYDASTSNTPSFHIHARKLLELCFPNELNPVVISADLMDLMYEIQKNEAINSSIIVIDKDFSSKVMNQYYSRHPSYLISADSMNTLQNTILEIKSSAIWNVASMIVATGKKCHRAEEVLRAIWKIEALNSFYVCQLDSMSETFIFTFNPFTRRAPKQWKQVEDQPGDRWTLYRQRFRNNKSICSSVAFDKTRSLDGYPLKGFCEGEDTRVFKGKFPPNASSRVSLSEQYLFNELFTALNATPIIYMNNSHEIIYNTLSVFFTNGTYDIWLQYYNRVDSKNFQIIPLYTQGGFLIITKKQNTIPVLSEVADNFFTYQTTTIGVFSLIMIFLLIFVNYRYDFGGAILDVLSFVLGMGISTPIIRLFIRVTFFTTILFTFFYCPELQSQFTSVLTSPAAQKNIETLQELRDSQYQIFYHPFATVGLRDLNIWENSTFKGFKNLVRNVSQCLKRLRTNSRACILPDHFDNITIGDLHVSKKSFFKNYNFLTIRKNSPLKQKINKAALNLVEAGFVDYMEKKNLLKSQLKKQKLIDRIEAFDQAEFLDLPLSTFLQGFAFVVSFSLFVFLIELVLGRVKKYKEKRMREYESRKIESVMKNRDS